MAVKRTSLPDTLSAGNLKPLLSPILNDKGGGFAVDRRTLYGKQAERIYTNNLTEFDEASGYQRADQFYNPKVNEVTEGRASFVVTDIPTSSTNYKRPRTVAAGYDPDTQTMTVVFRDGVFYNYYDVTPSEWDAFRASYSKGKPWLNRANKNQSGDGLFVSKRRGPALDMASVDPEIRAALYRVARTYQQKSPPKLGRTSQTASLVNGEKMPVKNRAKNYYNPSKANRQKLTANRPRKAS